MSTSVRAEIAASPPTTFDLFRGFLTLGMLGFGGVMPLARHIIVEQRRWLGAAEFTHLLGLCQFLPGGNVINLSVAVGLRFHGIRGALASILGLIAVPTAFVVGLGIVYDRFRDDPRVQHVFAGLAAAAAGLLISAAIKIALPLRDRPLALVIAGACVLAMAVWKLPLLFVLSVMAPISIIATSRFGS